MVDSVSSVMRSRIMAKVRAKNTKPEMHVRRLLHAAGYRYRLHNSELPGSPDIVFVARKKVIFVHGCFWHRHLNCKNARIPKSRIEFWTKKLEGNRLRDEVVQRKLVDLGWSFHVVWECNLISPESVLRSLHNFLE